MKQLCHCKEIDDPGSKEFSVKRGRATIDGFVVHKNGAFYAYQNSCPHTGASLNWQQDQFLDIDLRFIQCSIHHALFEIESGYCIAGPCSGSSMEELDLIIDNNILYLNI